MAGNKFQIKRTAVSGRAANNSIIDAGELAINITDGIMYSTNGTNVFEIGANLTSLSVSGIAYPTTDGTNGQVLTTDGNGSLSFSSVSSSGGINNVVEDTTPQLGGDLDLNGFNIIGSGQYSAVGNVNITSTFNMISPDGNNTISVEMLDSDTVSFSGDSGELFSVTDSMTGTIFSVNDISGIPSIEVDDDGTVRFAELSGNVLIGTNVDDGTNKVQVDGNVSATAFSGDGSALTNISYTVTEGDVTQHQAALSITESQISDFGTYLTSETVTSLSLSTNILTYTDESGVDTDIDLSLYLDDTNLARLVSGTLDGQTGIATFTRDDSSTFTVDFSPLFDDTNLARIDSASFGTGDGVLTLTRDDATTVTVDLDGRYLTSFTETNDLTSAVTWANVPDANITESSVTQHQAALSITESQISDFGTYLTDAPSDGNQYARQNGSWSVVAATNVVDDTTPQLGGDLDLNNNDITGTGNIDITGNVSASTINLQNSSFTSTTITLATVTQTPVNLFTAADYSSGKVIVQATDTVTGEVHISELLIAHDDTTAYVTEYGVVFTGSAALAEYAVDIDSGNVRLLITSASTNSTQYNITQTLVGAFVNNAFELTVETTSTNEEFLLPMQSVTSIDIDWGDGTVDTGITSDNPTHVYAAAGTHAISVTGTAGTVVFYDSGSQSKLRTVTNLGALGWSSFANSFRSSGMTSFDAGDCDTSNVTDMESMFELCTLTSLDLSSFDTSNVTNMSFMFNFCFSLSSLDLSSFDTSNVTNMDSMFRFCSSLTSLDVGNFDTSNVTSMEGMFRNCSSLTSLDLSSFDTSNVTNFYYMFRDCPSLTSLDVSIFDTSNVTDMESMFGRCSSLTSLDVSNFDTSNVTNMRNMFLECYDLTSLDVSNFDTSNVTNMLGMFDACESLTSLDVSIFDTSNVTDMTYMFFSCSSLTSLDVGNFDTSNVTSMEGMFWNSSSLTDVIGAEDFNIEALDNTFSLNNFMRNVTLPTARYDSLLINWDAQEPFDGMSPHFGNSQYTAGGAAEAARTSLINGDGWTITDGGSA